jgi:peptidyl-prolyl cis-trans isomerase A (cyclophilin A)
VIRLYLLLKNTQVIFPFNQWITGIPVRKLSFFLLTSALALFNHGAIGATNPSIVELQTNLGTITIQLNYAKAPISSKNFINYAESGFYKDTLMHRVVKDFVVQGGGVDKLSSQFKPTNPAIKNEASNGLKNVTGTVAMARTNLSNSATSQFFINLVSNPNLDYDAIKKNDGYAVFGKVIKGMSVVESIGKLHTAGQLPISGAYELVSVDNVYTSASLNSKVSSTRITINGQGKVSSVPTGIVCGTACSLAQAVGAPLKLTATPVKGYYFAGWRGDCQGVSATLTINTKLGNHNCTALFSKAVTPIS